MKLTVILTTKNRPGSCMRTLRSILNNQSITYELILVDQSTNHDTEKAFHNIPRNYRRNCTYIKTNEIGLSRGRNLGIRYATGSVCVFTDDDCIVSKNWLRSIQHSFQNNPDISAVFGSTYPYRLSYKKGFGVPSIFARTRELRILNPCAHFKYIGYGNNMAIRSKVFAQEGNFKSWLGVGSIGASAEDAEYALRLLLRNHRILSTPTVRVYHDRWLPIRQLRKQQLLYAKGEEACYGYFASLGYKFALPILQKERAREFRNVTVASKKILILSGGLSEVNKLFWSLVTLWYRMQGYVIGWYHARRRLTSRI